MKKRRGYVIPQGSAKHVKRTFDLKKRRGYVIPQGSAFMPLLLRKSITAEESGVGFLTCVRNDEIAFGKTKNRPTEIDRNSHSSSPIIVLTWLG